MTESSNMRRYELKCTGGDPELGSPVLAVFDLDDEGRRQILSLASLSGEGGWDTLVTPGGRVVWYDTPGMLELHGEEIDPEKLAVFENFGFVMKLAPVPAERVYLHVAGDRFWFSCRRRYSEDEVRTRDILLTEIEPLPAIEAAA